MEKKDWKDRLREFPFIKMYLLKKFKANNPREQGMADILTLVKDKEFYDLIDFISKELDKAREEGRREQAELDRTLYGVSFEHIKNADFEKILLESVDKAKENIIKDLIKKIEEAHCDSISLELLKEIDLSKLKGQ